MIVIQVWQPSSDPLYGYALYANFSVHGHKEKDAVIAKLKPQFPIGWEITFHEVVRVAR